MVSEKTNLIMSYPSLNFFQSPSLKSHSLTKAQVHLYILHIQDLTSSIFRPLERLYSSYSRLLSVCFCFSTSFLHGLGCCCLLSPASCKPLLINSNFFGSFVIMLVSKRCHPLLYYSAMCCDMILYDSNGLFPFYLKLCKLNNHTCNLYLYL